MSLAITQAITTLSQAENRFSLVRVEAESFFSEWQTGLPALTSNDQTKLDELRQRCLYQRSEGQLLEGTVMLLLASPLLAIAGFYDPPFIVKAEESVQLHIYDPEEILQGHMDVLVLKDHLWVVVLESKKTALSAWAALPQTLAYLMANPQAEQPSFGMVTNGDDIFFIKLTRRSQNQYALSRVFNAFTSKQELYTALRILRNIGQPAKRS